MRLRARVDFSGSVRFEAKGADTAAAAKEAAHRADALRLVFVLLEKDGRTSRVSGLLRLLDHGRLVIEDVDPGGGAKEE